MSFLKIIRAHVAKVRENKREDAKQNNKILEEMSFEFYFKKWSSRKNIDRSQVIPKFYHETPKEMSILPQKLQTETRLAFLQRKFKEVLTNDELERLGIILKQLPSSINYNDYLKVSDIMGPRYKSFFTATIFAKLQNKYPKGKISIVTYFQYVTRKVWMQKTRIDLSLYDSSGKGYLTEQDMERYLFEFLPPISKLKNKNLLELYIRSVTRKFLFFLDTLKRNQIYIPDIFASGFLNEVIDAIDENLTKEELKDNWFSVTHFEQIFDNYLILNENADGMLSKRQLMKFGSGTLTLEFLDRIFEEFTTFEGKMDFRTYLDLVIAFDHSSEPQSLEYFFKLLDINHQGYLDAFTLNYFYKGIRDEMRYYGGDIVDFDDIKDEIFDMVKPQDPTKITLNDLIDCGCGSLIVKILIDFKEFCSYESRETQGLDSDDDDEADDDDVADVDDEIVNAILISKNSSKV